LGKTFVPLDLKEICFALLIVYLICICFEMECVCVWIIHGLQSGSRTCFGH
jgi:hypothetical protein